MDNQDTLLLVAGVNLAIAVAMALPLARRHLVATFRAAVASVAGVWTSLMSAAFLYFQATEPSEFLAPHPAFFLSALTRNDAAFQWDMRLRMTISLALWTMAATIVAVLVLWLMSAFRGRSWEGATS